MERKRLPHYQGQSIVNGPLIAKPLEALQLPAEVAIIYHLGHQASKDPVALSNARAN